MSTRCYIGTIENNKTKTIYCQSDGYPSHVGKYLLGNCDTKEKVEELMFADISYIDPEENHIEYYSDEDADPVVQSLDELMQSFHASPISYIYLFSVAEKKWTFYNGDEWADLTPDVCGESR